MGRVLPTECSHGRAIDWGDFGPDGEWGEGCDACGIEPYGPAHNKDDLIMELQNQIADLQAAVYNRDLDIECLRHDILELFQNAIFSDTASSDDPCWKIPFENVELLQRRTGINPMSAKSVKVRRTPE